MNYRVVPAAVVVALLTLGACGSDPTDPSATAESSEGAVTRYWIKPDLVDCVGEMEQRCMQVAESADGDYSFFYDQIVGFEFVEGTSYVIDVRIDQIADPPADGSLLAYTLVEVIESDPN